MLFVKELPTTKPVNDSGMECPLKGKACSKVCHKCELWQPLEMEVSGKPTVLWKCSLNWSPFIAIVNNSRMDGVQRATEDMRNKFAEYARMSARLIADLPRLLLSLPPPPPVDGGSLNARDTG